MSKHGINAYMHMKFALIAKSFLTDNYVELYHALIISSIAIETLSTYSAGNTQALCLPAAFIFNFA